MNVKPNDFVHLHGHSMFSPNDGMMKVEDLVDRAKELETDKLIDDQCIETPFVIVNDQGYSNWELDGPDVMWSDDPERNESLRYHMAYLEFWTDEERISGSIHSIYQQAERIMYHSQAFAQIILENLEDSGVKLEVGQ